MNVFEQAWKHESENRKRRVTFQKATQQANARDDAVSGETWYLIDVDSSSGLDSLDHLSK